MPVTAFTFVQPLTEPCVCSDTMRFYFLFLVILSLLDIMSKYLFSSYFHSPCHLFLFCIILNAILHNKFIETVTGFKFAIPFLQRWRPCGLLLQLKGSFLAVLLALRWPCCVSCIFGHLVNSKGYMEESVRVLLLFINMFYNWQN